jgi:hypothetical protein
VSAQSSQTYATYDLTEMPENGVYGLSGGLLPEMARALGYKLGDQPTEDALRGFIGHVGPAKFLQDNIALVQALLGTTRDATAIAADWADRSKSLTTHHRSFVNPELQTPDEVNSAIITGGVARWMLRRANRLVEHLAAGNRVEEIILAAGSRTMKASEHPLVAAYIAGNGEGPKESDFMKDVIAPQLRFAVKKYDVAVRVVAVDSESGSEVMDRAAFVADLGRRNRTAVVISNAPAGVQNAAQLREAGRGINPAFDRNGDQLFVLTDSIEVARHGEGPATHQNPFTALGQIARNALHIFLEQQALSNQN